MAGQTRTCRGPGFAFPAWMVALSLTPAQIARASKSTEASADGVGLHLRDERSRGRPRSYVTGRPFNLMLRVAAMAACMTLPFGSRVSGAHVPIHSVDAG